MDFASGHGSNHSRGLLHGQAGPRKEVPVARAPCGPQLNPLKAASVTPNAQRDSDLGKHEVPRYRDAGRLATRPDQPCLLHGYEDSHYPDKTEPPTAKV